MGNFNKFDKGRGDRGGFGGGGGGRKFGGGGGGRRFGGPSDGPRQMFPATCGKCGQSCEVPFRPSGDRPVFCNSCFKSQDDGGSRFAPKSFGGGNRDGSFGGNASGNANVSTGGGFSKAQIDALNVKLDKILSILAPAKKADTPKVEVAEIKTKKEIVKKEKTPVKKAKGKKK